MMRLALHAVVAACSLHTASALAVRFGGRPAAAGSHENLQGHGRGGQRAGQRPPSGRLTSGRSSSAARAARPEGSSLVTCSGPRRPSRAASRRRARLVRRARQPRAPTCVWLPVSFLPTPTSRSCRGATSGMTPRQETPRRLQHGGGAVPACAPRAPSRERSGRGIWTAGGESESPRICAGVASRRHVLGEAFPPTRAAAQSDLEASGVPPHAPGHEGPRDHKNGI